MAARKRVESWVVTDEFWARVEPLIPVRQRPAGRDFARKAGAGRKAKPPRLVFEAIVYVMPVEGIALNHLVAAMIAFRKIPLKFNIIYG